MNEAREHYRIGKSFLVHGMDGMFKIATDPAQWSLTCEDGREYAYEYLETGLRLLKFDAALHLLSYGYEPAYVRFLEDLKDKGMEWNGRRKKANGFG